MSSPSTYSRRSSKSMLRPLCTEPYSPSSTLRTLRCAWIVVRVDLAEERPCRSTRPRRRERRPIAVRSRRRDGGEDRVDDRLDLHVVGDGLEAQVQAVAQHGVTQCPHVVGHDVACGRSSGRSARPTCCSAIAPRGLAPNSTYAASSGSITVAAVARGLGDRDGVALDRLVDVHPRREVDEEQHVGEVDDSVSSAARAPSTPRSMRLSTSSSSSAVG